jgi:hypothetical protein
MRCTKAGACLAALCALALASGTAGAGGTTDYPTFFVKFKFAQGKFTGEIDSSKGKCVQNRKIVLVRKKDGDKKKLGSDKTNDKGKFKIGVGGSPKNGKYFAQADAKNVGADTCGGEKSAKVQIG